MPTRTYTAIDLIDYATNFLPGTDSPPTPNTPSQGVGSMTISASGDPLAAGEIICNAQLRLLGNFDFDAFPAIPAAARITEIDFSWDSSFNLAANASAGAGTVDASVAGLCVPTLGATQLVDSLLVGNDVQNDIPLTASAVVARTTSFDAHTVLEFGPGITKSQLITAYGSILFELTMNLHAGFGTGVVTDITGTIGMNNFNLIVTYEEGPVQFTVSPSGGDVAPGQIIVVSGPGVTELEYAFETEDGAIIPVEIQIVGDEVHIEAPYPATDPCFDCFPECPQCEEAFIPCDEDLTGEECQEAMQECLDCLTDCLEDLQLAEECQESSSKPKITPTIVILIVGTQFAGTVQLGTFTILNANGSGLYRFSLAQIHDTLYAPDRDGTTYDVKIPNPGGKTGFFRS